MIAHGDDPIERAEDALDLGDFEGALSICDSLLRDDPEDADALAVRGDALAGLGRLEEALATYEAVQSLVPDWNDGDLSRARILAELGRLDEAEALVTPQLSAHPDDAEVQLCQALLLDVRGSFAAADEAYQEAHRLAPESHPLPYRLADDAFMAAVHEAYGHFPAKVRMAFENMTISVPDMPPLDQVRDPHSPMTAFVLGFYDGTPRSAWSTENPWSGMPSHIFLFKRNLERICTSREELVEQIDVTLKHELGHFLGLDEDDMHRLGLE